MRGRVNERGGVSERDMRGRVNERGGVSERDMRVRERSDKV